MINNLDNAEAVKKIDEETGKYPEVKAIHEIVAGAQGSYGVNRIAFGLEYTSTTEVKGYPNRCRMKLFRHAGDSLVAWFYKRSAIPYSRDRFSYGGVVWSRINERDLSNIGKDVNDWLKWLDSGLDPAMRPANWISAFPFDLPE